MNSYGAIILVAVLAEFGIRRAADIRNIRALRPEVPDDFAGVYDPRDYARSQAYTRERTALGVAASSVRLAALLAFWAAGGFARLDGWVDALALGPVAEGLVFLGLIASGTALLSLPFRAYSVFRLEGRYGFNRTTPRVFLADLVKGLTLLVVLGGGLLAGVLALFAHGGPRAWLYAWALVAGFLVVVQYVVPAWIMPLFNRFTALEDGEMRQAITRLAREAGFPGASVWVVDGSRRSARANAFFTGFGRTRRIALFDTLLEQHPPAEVLAVVAHELGHYRLRHVPIGLALEVGRAGVMLAAFDYFLAREGLFAAFGVDAPSVHAGILFFALLATPFDFVVAMLTNALSRLHERRADAFSVRLTGSPEAMISALQALARNNLANLTPDPLYVAVGYSHPPIRDRIRALRPPAPAGG